MMNIQSSRDDIAAIRTVLACAGAGSPAITIGVIDGLPDLNHPAFRAASIDIAEEMIPPDGAAPDAHGTGVCSLIFGNSETIHGLAPRCSGLILPLFFRKDLGGPSRPVSQLDLARAISFGLGRNASIINISAGQKSATPEAEAHLDHVLEQAAQQRILIVAAAGNDGCACIHLPAAVETVMSVGALDAAGRPLDASNWAEPYRRNGLLAPGENIPVAVPGGGVSTGSGTSFATAVVSGVAALLLSVAREESYRIDALDIRDILLESATPCEPEGDGACDRYLAGTLNAASALATVHRVGTARRSFTMLPGGGGALRIGADSSQITNLARGGLVMSNANSVAAAAVEPSALSPSACSCQQTEDDEVSQAASKPRALGLAPTAAPPLAPAAQTGVAAASLSQQSCSCGCSQPPQIVFAIGALWFDFGSEARYDALVQQPELNDPITPDALFAFLRNKPQFVSGITFILMQEQVPIYAVQPVGPFAKEMYDQMLETLRSSTQQAPDDVQRVSIPGYIAGSTRLMNGMTVPVVYPDLRGFYTWRSEELIKEAKAAVGKPAPDETLRNYLHRIYYELRNLGIAPQDRALNFAATNAYQAANAFADSVLAGLALDDITVTKSPICRPDSDCWDIVLQMFDPENQNRPNVLYRFTVDVSEVIPVTVGDPRRWYAPRD